MSAPRTWNNDWNNDQPGVSYVMPVLNEVDYLEAAVDSILAQAYDGKSEVILALGPSTDGTTALAHRLRRRDGRIRAVDNPAGHIPHALNRAIAAATHPVIVRVDAHTRLPHGYTTRAVATLQRTGAATVGGVMRAVGQPGVQVAVARAYNSRLGLGGGRYHGRDAGEGPAESAYLGVMRTDVLREIGGYDESVRRGEDWELTLRMRRGGHVVWLDPALEVDYWPRDSLSALARQLFSTGVWRGELVRRVGAHNSLRFFAPPALVLSLAGSAVVVPTTAARLVPRRWWPLRLVTAGPVLYAAVLGAAAGRAPGSAADRARYAAVLATMHVSWGTGFLRGLVRGAGDTVDTSRVHRRSR